MSKTDEQFTEKELNMALHIQYEKILTFIQMGKMKKNNSIFQENGEID